ncbi:MAG TPA: DNA-processing protein DprA, partial [Chloroflexota bacterium]|nr:DNA-processing protein DprA [Chloroflexota bacterium]
AWRAPRGELTLAGLDRRSLEALEQVKLATDPLRELERARRLGLTTLTWRDEAYPQRLAAIPDPPPVLYVRGDLEAAGEWSLAMVGTRRPTYYGRGVAERLATELAAAGVVVISGLAKGIDTHAHRGALAGGGRTVAVLGHGLDTIYPPENRALAGKIAEHGALVSEYAPGVAPAAENFPPRNRIISGLAAGVLVVEAGEKSGALITSRYAADQGRDVFAVPGPITSLASAGCHRLIQDGAKLVTGAGDVLVELDPPLAARGVTQLGLALDDAPPAAGAGQTGEAIDHQRVLLALSEAGEPAHVDQLARRLGRPVQAVSGTLTLLEVQGQVRHVGGMRYALVR